MSNRVFKSLPVLTDLRQRLGERGRPLLERTLVVAVQHLLESTGSLLEELLHLGVAPKNLLVLGKYYSTSQAVLAGLRRMGATVVDAEFPRSGEMFADCFSRDVESLWETAGARIKRDGSINRVVILDDGGRAIGAAPRTLSRQVEIIGIEQTTSGLAQRNAWPAIPVIEVAGSAIKRHVEPVLVADAVIAKARTALQALQPHAACGVIGLGNVGGALARALSADGHLVLGYDVRSAPVSSGIEKAADFRMVLERCDYIFGCTGSDIFTDRQDLPARIGGNKVLLSCSSEDAEFRTLLAGAERNGDHPLADLIIPAGETSWRIVRGGYPVNFDGTPTSVPSVKIQLTRGLLLAGVFQAVLCNRPPVPISMGEKLWPEIQRRVFRTWIGQAGQPGCPNSTVTCATDLQWLANESTGESVSCPTVD